MRIITISREFGSGGRELGKRLADQLGFDYYDRTIIDAIAQNRGLDSDYVEKQLENHGWRNIPITFRRTIGTAQDLSARNVSLLLEQKKVLERIAALGKDCVIVGRNADVILAAYQPLNLFVCANLDTKIQRCMERAPENEQFTEKELLHHMKQIDKTRSKTREILSAAPWGQRETYHLTINTSGWNLKELSAAVADFANHWFRRDP